MIKLTIDNKELTVPQGTSIMEAAKSIGIDIPSMCYLKGYSNHPSCMVCMVKDKKTGQLHPSCAYPAKQEMEVITNDEEVVEARRDALELLLSDHVGDCEAPCRIGCPAFMDIPKMNRLIAAGKANEALQVVKDEIALPIVLGYVCKAPCENACRRKAIDETVAICQLKKHVALVDANSKTPYLPQKEKDTGKGIVIIGAGPAGLACAFHLVKLGNKVTVIDNNKAAGGSLLKLDLEKELPKSALDKEIDILKQFGVLFELGTEISKQELQEKAKANDAVILATGNIKKDIPFGLSLNSKETGVKLADGVFATEIAGVYACGSMMKPEKMAVRALAQGKAAAFYVHEKLSKQDKAIPRIFNSKFGRLKKEEFSVYLKESNDNAQFKPVNELEGYNSDIAIEEAKRCLHCDCRKPNTCKLRLYAEEYGAKQKQYMFGDRKLITKQFTHDLIVYEEEKCIRCGLCVDIAEKDQEQLGLTYVGRGFDVRIGIPYNESLENSLTKVAVKCAESCPTGAIALK